MKIVKNILILSVRFNFLWKALLFLSFYFKDYYLVDKGIFFNGVFYKEDVSFVH